MEQSLRPRTPTAGQSSGQPSPGATMDSFSPTRMLAWLALATGLASSPAELRARSQSDGEMGPVSRAAIGISVSIAPRLGAERAVPAQGQGLEVEHPRQQRLCIWSNAPVGTFSMIAS